MIKNGGMHWRKSLAVTLILIFVTVTLSFVTVRWINQAEENDSFERLYEEADSLARDIEIYAQNDREQLELLAALAAEYDDPASPGLWRLLDSFHTIGMTSGLAMLLPDDTVLTEDGQHLDTDGRLSFTEEAALGAHISERETALTDPGKYIIRHYVPVIRSGETVAMLYGIIELNRLPEELRAAPYGGKAAIYLIEGSSGNFLLDTWHDELGNIWDLGERKMPPGYDHEQLKQGLTDGKSAYVVFLSQTTGEYLYFYYTPMAINDWRIALSVPEDIVFSGARIIERFLNVFLLIEIICFLLYFLWMLRHVRVQMTEKQRQLDTISHIYDVEKLLFNAHEQRSNIMLALEKIARMASAEKAAFWMIAPPGYDFGENFFFWQPDEEGRLQKKSQGEERCMTGLFDFFGRGHKELETHDSEEIQCLLSPGTPELFSSVSAITAVPVETPEGEVCGILAACNMPDGRDHTAILKSVQFSFSMLCYNVRIHAAMKRQGERDSLTGLYNRNRYEEDLMRYSGGLFSSLTCVYIDVNGLHELNNTQGHKAGDLMLQTVAGKIRETFGSEYSYRIGGDEFVTFLPDVSEEEAAALCSRMKSELELRNYHISAGIQREENIFSMDELIKAAEQKMYGEKRRYYENKTRRQRDGS